MITFKTIRWKNFLSTGDQYTTVRLDQYDTTLIVGENGAGKSTMLDALCFGVFGKPFRNINRPQLLNSLNQRDCLVEVEFSIGSVQYMVRRGLKPNVFEIYSDGKLIDQDSRVKDYQTYFEENILKINYKSFCQVVILGSASYMPFMQLKASDRRFIIEDLLDIQIFSSMNVVLKTKIAELKDDMSRNENQTEITKERMKLLRKYIEEVNTNLKSDVAEKRRKIAENLKEREKLEVEVANLEDAKSKLEAHIVDHKGVKTRLRKLEALHTQLLASVKKLDGEIEFFDENTSCPTCKQDIDVDFRNQMLLAKNAKLGEVQDAIEKMTADISEHTQRITDIEATLKTIASHGNRLSTLRSDIRNIDRFVQNLNDEIEKLHERREKNGGGQEDLEGLKENLIFLQKEREKYTATRHLLDVVAMMLKDSGIKTRIVKQYLPIITKLINKYLTALDFFVNFDLDENFNESIRSRGRDEFTYASFSEGEKLRIDLAILFTWREVARMKNSANTNLLILDEVFDSSLDAQGTEDFLKLISNLGASTNLFIISHKGDVLQDKFSNVLRFRKVSNFSLLESE